MSKSKYDVLLISNFLISHFAAEGHPITNRELQQSLFWLKDFYRDDKIKLFDAEFVPESESSSIPVVKEVYEKYHAFGRDPIPGVQPRIHFKDGVIDKVDHDTVNYDLISDEDKTKIIIYLKNYQEIVSMKTQDDLSLDWNKGDELLKDEDESKLHDKIKSISDFDEEFDREEKKFEPKISKMIKESGDGDVGFRYPDKDSEFDVVITFENDSEFEVVDMIRFHSFREPHSVTNKEISTLELSLQDLVDVLNRYGATITADKIKKLIPLMYKIDVKNTKKSFVGYGILTIVSGTLGIKFLPYLIEQTQANHFDQFSSCIVFIIVGFILLIPVLKLISKFGYPFMLNISNRISTMLKPTYVYKNQEMSKKSAPRWIPVTEFNNSRDYMKKLSKGSEKLYDQRGKIYEI